MSFASNTSTYVPKPKVTVTVSPITPDDYVRVSRIQIDAFDFTGDPVAALMNPPAKRPPIEERAVNAAKQLADTVKAGGHFLKATLEDGTLAGYAVWRGPDEPLYPTKGNRTEDQIKAQDAWFEEIGFNAKFSEKFFDTLSKGRERASEGRKHW